MATKTKEQQGFEYFLRGQHNCDFFDACKECDLTDDEIQKMTIVNYDTLYEMITNENGDKAHREKNLLWWAYNTLNLKAENGRHLSLFTNSVNAIPKDCGPNLMSEIMAAMGATRYNKQPNWAHFRLFFTMKLPEIANMLRGERIPHGCQHLLTWAALSDIDVEGMVEVREYVAKHIRQWQRVNDPLRETWIFNGPADKALKALHSMKTLTVFQDVKGNCFRSCLVDWLNTVRYTKPIPTRPTLEAMVEIIGRHSKYTLPGALQDVPLEVVFDLAHLVLVDRQGQEAAKASRAANTRKRKMENPEIVTEGLTLKRR